MSNYSPANNPNNQSAEGSSSQTLDLLPLKRISDEFCATAECLGEDRMAVDEADADAGARLLFGFPICVKRTRENGGAAAAEHDQELPLQQPGTTNPKLEPLEDMNKNGDNQQTQCYIQNQRVCELTEKN